MTKKQRMIVQSLRLDLKDHYKRNRIISLMYKIVCIIAFMLTTLISIDFVYSNGYHLHIFEVFSVLINIIMGVLLIGSMNKYWIMRKPPYDKIGTETDKWDYENYVENYCRDYTETWFRATTTMMKLLVAVLILNFIP